MNELRWNNVSCIVIYPGSYLLNVTIGLHLNLVAKVSDDDLPQNYYICVKAPMTQSKQNSSA